MRSIPQHTTRSAALLRMLEHGVHHLALTDATGAITGVVRAVDLAAPQVRDPLRTRARIDTATTIDELATAAADLPATLADLHQHRLDVEHIAAMHTALVDAIVRQVLRLQPPPALSHTRHTWLLLGSMARREPLPSSDLDTALIWDDDPRTGGGEEAAESIRAGASRVLETLRRCGLRTCPAGTNADNPTFSRPRSQWRAAAADWRHDPHPDTLLMAAMLTDARPLTDPQLAKDLRPPPPRGNTRYPRAVLTEALGFRPPTGFVRGFVVEHTGEHRGQLDLKKGGLAPVVALARWVAMVCGTGPASTPARLRLGAEHHLLTTDEAQALTGAWRETYALVLNHELAAIRAGGDPTTFIAPRRLDSLTRRHLRDTFRLIRSIQTRLDEHWLARLERANLHTGQR